MPPEFIRHLVNNTFTSGKQWYQVDIMLWETIEVLYTCRHIHSCCCWHILGRSNIKEMKQHQRNQARSPLWTFLYGHSFMDILRLLLATHGITNFCYRYTSQYALLRCIFYHYKLLLDGI